MTKNEAIEKIKHIDLCGAEYFVEVFEKLGIIKFDKPVSSRELFIEGLLEKGYNRGTLGFNNILTIWDKSQK